MSYAGPAAAGRSSVLRPPEPSKTAVAGASPRDTLRPLRRPSTGVVFAAGVALGIAVGAGVALLFAPQSGEDTRRSLVRRGRKLTNRGRDAWDDLREELRAARRRRRHRKESASEGP